jgi:serine/threonine protein kinase
MSAINPAENLEGEVLENGWTITEKITVPEYATGGHFSVGYKAIHENGEEGFLKALDYSAALQSQDPARKLEELTKAFNFERDLLEKCKENRLSKVVMPLADGTLNMQGFGSLSTVNYIIFEKAEGNIRDFLELSSQLDFAWCIKTIHNAATGLMQLHSKGIAHQDLKPSNVLVFQDSISKISDLGRAADNELTTPPHADFLIPGDKHYAAPELFYITKMIDQIRKYGADIYQLGSLIFFYFTGNSAIVSLSTALNGLNKPNFSGNDFQNDLPFLQKAFTENIKSLETEINKFVSEDISERLVNLAKILCNPDPELRGHPREKRIKGNKYRLNRVVSELNLISKKAEIEIYARQGK